MELERSGLAMAQNNIYFCCMPIDAYYLERKFCIETHTHPCAKFFHLQSSFGLLLESKKKGQSYIVPQLCKPFVTHQQSL